MDEILKALGITWNDISTAEADTLERWVKDIDTQSLTLERVQTYLAVMRESVSRELAEECEPGFLHFLGIKHNKNPYLKARLMNYILLEQVLSSPARAKAELQRQLLYLKTNGEKHV